MNRQEYLDILGKELGSVSYDDVKSISDEINEHFDIGLAQGKTEESIAEGLGDPVTLAAYYKEIGSVSQAINNNRPRNRNSIITKPVKVEQPKSKSAGKLFVVFWNIFLGVPSLVLAAICLILITGAVVGGGLGFINLVGAVHTFGAFVATGVCLSIAVFFALVFALCVLYFLFRAYLLWLINHIRWNSQIWNEGM